MRQTLRRVQVHRGPAYSQPYGRHVEMWLEWHFPKSVA